MAGNSREHDAVTRKHLRARVGDVYERPAVGDPTGAANRTPLSMSSLPALEGTQAGGGADGYGARDRYGRRPAALHEYPSFGSLPTGLCGACAS